VLPKNKIKNPQNLSTKMKFKKKNPQACFVVNILMEHACAPTNQPTRKHKLVAKKFL
jgi:hypothetical protein